jgi:23S rRNA (guanosine2251-2'-O)-methyltransferase
MLLLLTARTIRGPMSRRKPDTRSPKRALSKSGSSPRNRVPEGRDRGDNRPEGHPGKAAGAANRPSKGKPVSAANAGVKKPGILRQGAERRPWEVDSGRRADRRPDKGPDQRPAERPGPTRHVGDSGERRPDQRSFDRRHSRGDLPVWLYGHHAVLAALDNDARYIRRLVLTRETREALQDNLPAGTQPEIIERIKLDSLLPPGAVHQGIAVLVDPLDDGGVESLKDPVEEDTREIVLLLDHVTDPRNVGAILRSAAAFGARAVIVTDRHAPEATGALAKAASGGLEVVPLIRVTNMARALDLLAEYGFWRVGLEMETDKTLAEAVHDIRRVALVLGAEDEGLRRLTREKCDFLAKLPMTGAVESLNVSAAAAVALYECVRG